MKRKVVSWIVLIVLLLNLVLMSTMCAHSIEHHCEDCAICNIISKCEDNVRSLVILRIALYLITGLVYLVAAVKQEEYYRVERTLVRDKIRIDS